MSDHPRHLTTEEERERFHQARRRGRMCAASGRPLEDGEAAYVERFETTASLGRITHAAARGPGGDTP